MQIKILKTIITITGLLGICFSVLAQNIPAYTRSVHTYNAPDLALTNQFNKAINLNSYINNKIVLLDFFYTRCKTTCPVVTSDFANFQFRVKPDTNKMQLISITIDPENDSVAVLSEFQKRYKAQPGWSFFTGSKRDILKTMEAFSTFTKNKMGFYPLIFLYVPQKKQWVQIEGYIPVGKLVEEYQNAINH